MFINLIRLSNRGSDDEFLNDLNVHLQSSGICLKTNAENKLVNFILIESGGVEQIFKDTVMPMLEGPYYFIITNRNNSLAASLEIGSYLYQNKIKYTLLVDDNMTNLANKIKDIVILKTAKNKIKGINLGVIGNPSDWLIASNTSYFSIKQKFGINMIDISLGELKDIYEKDINYISPYHMPIYQVKNPFDKHILTDAIKVYSALKKIIKRYNLSGLTIRCFDLLKIHKVTACLALAILNQEGYPCSCEGDIPSLLTMVIIKYLLNKPSFQANPSYVNNSKNTITFAHCTVALNMCQEYKFLTHFESDESIGIKGELKTGIVNICKLSQDLQQFDVVVARIDKNLSNPNFCRTQVEVSLLDATIDDFINMHHANHILISYDNHKRLLLDFMKEFE